MSTVTLSFDIEEFDYPLERGREIAIKEQMDISTQGLEYILKALAQRNIHATFYITANYAKHRPARIRKIAEAGHEIASHDFYHSMVTGSEAGEGKKILQKMTGKEVIGYRAPRLSSGYTDNLPEAGFKYDSSINPTWIPGRYNNLGHPRTATKKYGFTVFPVSVSYPLRFPLFWLSLHVLPLRLYNHFAMTALRHDGNLSLYFHPWEFSEALKAKEYGMPFFIKMCCGTKYRQKFELFLDFLLSQGVEFKTTRDYLNL